MLGNPGHRERLLCVSGKRGLIVCWLDGDGNSSVGRDWCGWVSDTLCALGRKDFFFCVLHIQLNTTIFHLVVQ